MSILLLDTHALLWFLQDDPSLSRRARQLIENPRNRKLVSVASCWEIAIKVGTGKLHIGEPTRPYLKRLIAQNHFDLLAISFEPATEVGTLPQHHKDPFDRLLIAQAIVEGIPILSADVVFDAYPVQRIW